MFMHIGAEWIGLSINIVRRPLGLIQ